MIFGLGRVKPLHVAVSALMLATVVLFYIGLAGISLFMGGKHDLVTAHDTVKRIGRELSSVFNAETLPVESAIAVLKESPLLTAARHEDRLNQLGLMAAALEANPTAASVYGGTGNGSFVLLRRLYSESDRKTFSAPDAAVYLLQSVNRDGGKAAGMFRFYDAGLKPILSVDKPDYQFDPRTRPWYELALRAEHAGQVVETAPYVFASNRKIGITLAHAAASGRGVVGMDLTLGAMSRLIEKQHVTPSAQLAAFNETGKVLAYADIDRMFRNSPDGGREVVAVAELGVPALAALYERWKEHADSAGATSLSGEMELAGEDWYFQIERIRETAGQSLFLGIAAPRHELMANSLRIRNVTLALSLIFMGLMIPLIFLASKAISRPIRDLVGMAGGIERFDFAGADPGASRITEVDDLARAMTRMKHTLKRFHDISSALAAEGNFDRLLGIILRETISVAGAAGGSIYLLAADGKTLTRAAEQLQGNVVDVGAARGAEWPDAAGDIEASAVRERRLQSVRIERADSGSPSGLAAAYRNLFEVLDARRLQVVAVPLFDRSQQAIGVMSLILIAPDDENEEAISAALLAFVEALSGTAAVALDNRKLVLDQKILFEGVIELVAHSIDAKSAYSGGHCQRVPELAKMLARAACDQTRGPFAGFSLSDDDWEALHVAGWLHDCGKLTTPEYVVDKATKLETIYDRIHEIRMRFEVLKRDAEIDIYRRSLAGQADREAVRAELAPRLAELDDDFAFVAACNVGGETIAPEQLERLKRIAGKRWLRTLDDRLGISHEEQLRRAVFPVAPPPAWETLLADKPDHVVPRPEREQIAPDNRWGFKIAPPPHLYNRGELHNLSISRGTLTGEDRYKINEHIVQTIKMLAELPFPKHLRRVPEIAGGHHEKLDGTGYPCRLSASELSVEARIMAIADVFEALTAVDRPYKKGKTLSEAIRIMAAMKREAHIDPELFDLFVASGVYLEYARRFMQPEQIDSVDVAACLGRSA